MQLILRLVDVSVDGIRGRGGSALMHHAPRHDPSIRRTIWAMPICVFGGQFRDGA